MRPVVRAAAAVAALLVALALIAAVLVRLPAVQRWAAAQVAARLPPGATVDRAVVTLLPPGIELSNVSLGGDGPRFASVSCHLRARALLAGRFELGTLILHGASMTVERAADGAFHAGGPLADVLGAASAGTTGTQGPAVPGLDSLPAVKVEDAAITFIDRLNPRSPQPLQLDVGKLTLAPAAPGSMEFTVAARLPRAGEVRGTGTVTEATVAGGGSDQAVTGSFTVGGADAGTIVAAASAFLPGGEHASADGSIDGALSLSGRVGGGLNGQATITQTAGSFLWDDVRFAAPITLAADLAMPGDQLALSNGRFGAASLAAGRVAATSVTAGFDIAGTTLRLTSAQATAYSGTWSQRGTVTFAEPPQYAIELTARDVHCDALLSAVIGEHPQYGCDRLALEADLRGPWTGAATVADHAAGSGRIEMRGGTIPSSSILGALWGALTPMVAVRAPAHIGGSTRVERVSESFTLRNGRMDTNDLTLVTDDYTVTGAGSIGFDGSLDLQTHVALSPAGVVKLLTMASLPVPSDVPDLPAVPTRIAGTLASPVIVPAASEIPLVAVRGLFRGVRGAGEALTGTAERGLRGLTRDLERAIGK